MSRSMEIPQMGTDSRGPPPQLFRNYLVYPFPASTSHANMCIEGSLVWSPQRRNLRDHRGDYIRDRLWRGEMPFPGGPRDTLTLILTLTLPGIAAHERRFRASCRRFHPVFRPGERIHEGAVSCSCRAQYASVPTISTQDQ